jgi:hypothetical protein
MNQTTLKLTFKSVPTLGFLLCLSSLCLSSLCLSPLWAESNSSSPLGYDFVANLPHAHHTHQGILVDFNEIGASKYLRDFKRRFVYQKKYKRVLLCGGQIFVLVSGFLSRVRWQVKILL